MTTDIDQDQPEEQLLYHYCDAVAFESMIRTNRLWLSPFRHSNDSEEGIRAERMLVSLATKSGLETSEVEDFRETLEAMSKVSDCYGLCLSEHGDLLSQWRGYADDGAGFSIGFRRSALEKMRPPGDVDFSIGEVRGPLLHKVLYDEQDQLVALKPWVSSMLEHIRNGHRPSPQERISELARSTALPGYMQAQMLLHDTLISNWDQLYRVKNEAFLEEAECRLVLSAFQHGSVPFKYRTRRGMIIPYLEYGLPDRALSPSPIAKVYLGPKNRTPLFIVQIMLKQFDLGYVEVINSGASYR